MKLGHYFVKTRLQGVINSILPYAFSVLNKLIPSSFTGFERVESHLIIAGRLIMQEPRYKQQEFHSRLSRISTPITISRFDSAVCGYFTLGGKPISVDSNVRGRSSYPPILSVNADMPDRQPRATSGRKPLTRSHRPRARATWRAHRHHSDAPCPLPRTLILAASAIIS